MIFAYNVNVIHDSNKLCHSMCHKKLSIQSKVVLVNFMVDSSHIFILFQLLHIPELWKKNRPSF